MKRANKRMKDEKKKREKRIKNKQTYNVPVFQPEYASFFRNLSLNLNVVPSKFLN